MDGTIRSVCTCVRLTAAIAAASGCLLGAGVRAAGAQTDAYVANTTAGTLRVFDTAHPGAPPQTIAVGGSPSQVVMSADGLWAFAASSTTAVVSKINTTSREVTAIDVGDAAASIAVTPNGDRLYVLRAAGTVDVFDTVSRSKLPVPAIPVGSGSGAMAVTPDGKRLYVAAGTVTVIDTATNTRLFDSFAPEQTPDPNIYNFAVNIAISPGADQRAYVTFDQYRYEMSGFSADGGLAVLDTNATAPGILQSIELFSLPGAVTITGNGRRVFAAIPWIWADTLYGAGFLPSEWVASIDTTTRQASWINLGASATTNLPRTATSLAASVDGATLFAAVPSTHEVAAVDTTTRAVTSVIAIDGLPSSVATVPNPAARSTFKIIATPDAPTASVPAGGIRPAVANVLANDSVGGSQAVANANVTLAATATVAELTLDATGAVWVNDGAAAGAHTLGYQICDVDDATNCASADVTVTVRDPFHIGATNDSASAAAGNTAIASVLANDDLNLAPPASDDVTIAVVSGGDGALALDASGAVSVTTSAEAGTHSLSYHICEAASPRNCSNDATVSVAVLNRQIAAGDDAASAPRSGAAAVVNVLSNDTFDNAAATPDRVTLAVVSSTSSGLSLSANGYVSVAPGTGPGMQRLAYQICETAHPDNCAAGAVNVLVRPNVVNAVGESARLSARYGGVAIGSVLANDTVGDAPAAGNAILSLLAITPQNDAIAFDSATGAVTVAAGGSSGNFVVRYQICEAADPSNCSQAAASINLSNGGRGR